MKKHNQPVRPLVLLACVMSGILFSAGGCEDGLSFHGPRESREVSETIEFQEDTKLTVNSRNGAVLVQAEPGAEGIRIEARLTCGGETEEMARQRVEDAVIVATFDEDAGLEIEPRFPDPPNSGDSASITVITPAADGIQIETSNGPIVVEGAGDAFTSDLQVKTSNAAVTLSQFRGPATINTSNGPVQVSDVDGQVTVDTSNAPVTATSVRGALSIESSNAPVRIHLGDDQSGPITADTSNAPVTVELGRRFQGKMDVNTSNARVQLQDPSGRVTENKLGKKSGYFVVGNDETESRINTSNSPIEITLSTH